MGFLDSLRADLKKAAIEQQRVLVVELLHQRLAELTLEDLRVLLASPLGSGLGAVRIIDLVSPAPANTSTSAASPKGSQSRGRSKQKKVKSEVRARTRRSPASKKTRRTSEQIRGSVLSTIRSAVEPLFVSEIETKTAVHRKAIVRALRSLSEAGQVITLGDPNRPRYGLPGKTTGGDKAGASKASTAKRPTTTKKQSKSAKKQPKPKAVKVTGRTADGRAAYDAAVVEVLKASGGWIAATEIRRQVGGTANQLRIALDRLGNAGRVQQRGEKGARRYSLVTPE